MKQFFEGIIDKWCDKTKIQEGLDMLKNEAIRLEIKDWNKMSIRALVAEIRKRNETNPPK